MPNDFSAALLRYLLALKLPGSLPEWVRWVVNAHDFSGARAALVASVPGLHHGPDECGFGHLRMRALLNQASSPFRGSDVVLQFSSLGSIDEAWLMNEFGASLLEGPGERSTDGQQGQASSHSDNRRSSGSSSPAGAGCGSSIGGSGSNVGSVGSNGCSRGSDSSASGGSSYTGCAAHGAQLFADAAAAISSGSRGSHSGGSIGTGWAGHGVELPAAAALSPAVLRPKHLHLVWPTVEQVRWSINGWRCGLAGPQKNVGRPFLKPLWSHYGGHSMGRERVMPHIKTYVRHDGQRASWVLMGSHNFSTSAWGVKQACGGFLVKSYELSVLLLPELEARYLRHPHRGFLAAPMGGEAGRAAAAERAAAAAAAAAAQLRQQGQAQELPVRVEFWPVTAFQQQQQQQQQEQQHQGQQQQQQGQQQQQQGQQQPQGGGAVRMYVPLPYELPPPRYRYSPTEERPYVPFTTDGDNGHDCLGRIMGGGSGAPGRVRGRMAEEEEVGSGEEG